MGFRFGGSDMDWSRLGGATVDALLISFVLGGLFSPPDPITQTVVLPALLLVVLPFVYRYEPRLYARGWRRHVLFVVFVLAAQFVWNVLVRTQAVAPSAFYSPIRLAVLSVGVILAAWLAYLGGLERLRGEVSEA